MQQHLYSPKPNRAHHLYTLRHTSQLPIDLLRRPDTPRPDRIPTPPQDWSIQMSPMTPEQEVHVEEVRANAVVVRAMSKKKIACLVAVTAITSALLTATVTLTIHFTDCKK